MMDNEEATFNTLADGVERLLSQYGVAYQRGSGDFSLIHDYYGNRELGVIILKPIFNELILRQLRTLIADVAPEWEIWVTFEQGAEWNTHRQIVVSQNGWRPTVQRP